MERKSLITTNLFDTSYFVRHKINIPHEPRESADKVITESSCLRALWRPCLAMNSCLKRHGRLTNEVLYLSHTKWIVNKDEPLFLFWSVLSSIDFDFFLNLTSTSSSSCNRRWWQLITRFCRSLHHFRICLGSCLGLTFLTTISEKCRTVCCKSNVSSR